jgi:hypothetical protein
MPIDVNLGGPPVVVVDSGGVPVVQVLQGPVFSPVTEEIGGVPITLVSSGAEPIALIDTDGVIYEMPKFLFASGAQGAWYDPSDFSSMFQDSAGATPVTAVEQPVGLIRDKSGRGNHASQSTAAARPTLRARYNLLTYSEQLDNAAWTKSSATAVAGATDPNGGTTAETLTATGANGTCLQAITAVAANHIFSVWLRRTNGSGNVQITCDSAGTWVTQSITSSWARYTVTQTLTAGARNPGIRIVTNGDAVEAWAADLRVTNDGVGLPAYQRIAAATDYDTSGFPPYLAFDGTDDSLATSAIDFTSTDEMTVFAGVRKLSDAAIGMVAELSAALGSNAGTFYLTAPELIGASGNFTFKTRGGTNPAAYADTGTKLAPIAAILTGTGDISSDFASIRFNGGASVDYSADQGTGNFGNYALYIGRRGGSALPFNGRLYSLIVLGRTATAGEITNTEAWINSKAKVY